MDTSTLTLTEPWLDSYLRRIGAPARPARADAEALRQLHLRHLRSVPFENLSLHLGEDVSLEPADLLDKLLVRGRGGFCFELNGAFALLLRSLGYGVDLLEARVFPSPEAEAPGIPYGHLALRVTDADGVVWLADVGFGDHAHHPLALEERGEQTDPAGVFRLAPAEGAPEGDLDLWQDGVRQYRLSLRPRTLPDFAAASWWHRTSPLSHFTRGPVCTLLTETGRTTLSGRTLITTTAAGERTETPLPDDGGRLAAHRRHFGLTLDRAPTIP
ncbi:arylamine N-acetyltransferase [Streptomyces sp. NPDC097619]|uniref:arylamine N-acetyltransferase family protein n=1 Tax=Streptomyces sp. NPDC097619 TaxID=3157228 RepID=UPI00331EC97C